MCVHIYIYIYIYICMCMYSISHLYVQQQFFFSDPQRVICYEVSCWTSSDQYERVRAITPNLTHLLPIHIWDLITLISHMTPGRENGLLGPMCTFSLRGVLTFVASTLDINDCVLSYFEQIYTVIQALHSLLYIVAKCHFFSVVTWKDIIKYLEQCERCTHFCEILYVCIYVYWSNV